MGSERKYPPHEALARLEAFCAYQDRCSEEILRKSLSWGLNSDEAQELLNELLQSGFVDDARFTDSFVSGKFRYKKWGKIKIRYELKKKKVPENLIKKSISEIDPDLYYATLMDLGKKKWSEVKGKDLWDKKAKVMRFLSSKGFEQDLINDVVQSISQSDDR